MKNYTHVDYLKRAILKGMEAGIAGAPPYQGFTHSQFAGRHLHGLESQGDHLSLHRKGHRYFSMIEGGCMQALRIARPQGGGGKLYALCHELVNSVGQHRPRNFIMLGNQRGMPGRGGCFEKQKPLFVIKGIKTLKTIGSSFTIGIANSGAGLAAKEFDQSLVIDKFHRADF